MAPIQTIALLLLPCALHGQIIHEVTPLDLGSNTEDYAPIPLHDGFVISSVRETPGAVDYRDARSGKPLSDLYWVPLNGDLPGQPELFSAALTTPVNEGPAAFSQKGDEICYTRNLVLPKKLGNMRAANGELGLFFSRRSNDLWESPKAFPYNSPKFAVMHPTYGADGVFLYFASDMPGGLGGFDLYSCERRGDGWSEPRNLGPSINSASNEVFPRAQQDGTLYFSSDRIGGSGKLDIYSTRSDGWTWSTPSHLPEPINSSANDVGLTLRSDGYNAIMSSDRSGRDQIFLVERTVNKFQDCTEQRQDNFCYGFKARKHAATHSLPLDHVWDMGDGTLYTSNTASHCYVKPGDYEVRSLLVDRKSGAVFHVLNSNRLKVEQFVQSYITAPDTVRTGRQLALDPTRSNLPGFTAAQYHWDLGDGTTRKTPRVIHQFKQAGIYEVKLDILSRPDRDGEIAHQCNTKKIVVLDKYRELEDQTVVAVYQDLFGNDQKFEYQELPFDELALTFDENADVIFSVTLFASTERVNIDDPRFVEVRKLYRVIERFDPEKKVYTYSVGEAKNMEELYQVFKKVKQLQFLDAEVYVLEMEKLMDLSQLDIASLKELNNSKIRTSSIQFAFNSASIDLNSVDVLDQIGELLEEHALLQVVIEAHTDDIGSLGFNVDLSQQRAASVVDHLAARGIDRTRLIPIGHGKNQPIANNKTEEGRSKNRRVEFRFVVKEDLPSLVEVK